MKLRYLILALLALSFSPKAKANCSPIPFNFSEVTDVTVYIPVAQQPPTTFSKQVTYSGTTQMLPTCVPGTLHYTKAWNTLNGVGGWTQGQSVCTNCLATASSTVTANYQPGGIFYPGSDGGQAYCTFAGNFTGVPASDLEYEFAATKVVPVSNTTPHHWSVAPFCSNTGAPDYHPLTLYDPNNTILQFPYYWGVSQCHRPRGSQSGTLWTCADNVLKVAGDPRSGKQICTAHDLGNVQDNFPYWLYYGQYLLKLLLGEV